MPDRFRMAVKYFNDFHIMQSIFNSNVHSAVSNVLDYQLLEQKGVLVKLQYIYVHGALKIVN
jgi:hypothetical protein